LQQEIAMSTTPSSQQTLMASKPTNGMAIAGFVCSLIGLFSGGHILSPVGLILSAVALGRPGNRALAGWGVALGILGLCGWVLVLLVAGSVVLGLLAVALGIGLIALANPVKAEITADMAILAASIEEERDQTGYLPADLAVLNLDSSFLTDHWGNAYEYRLTNENERGYEIISAGEDGQIGSDDDITLTNLGDMWGEDGLVHVTTSEGDDGHFTVRIGDRTIDVEKDQGGGVTVDIGEEEIQVNDDDAGQSTNESTIPGD
jgi:hypothetical protein